MNAFLSIRRLMGMGLMVGMGSALVLAADAPLRVRTVLGGEYWWSPPTDAYLDYLGEVRPDVIHGAVLGPELASGLDVHGARKAITPLHPDTAPTMRAYLDWWRAYLRSIHRRGIKVQATISLVNAWGDADRQTGWFDYYNQRWETDLLGPRPAERAESLMEWDTPDLLGRNEGQPGWYRYRGCINHPAWREILKAFVRTGIETGFDGFMIQFGHARGACVCAHCQAEFRRFLSGRSRDDLAALGITDLSNHVFSFTAPRPGQLDPLDLAAREFTEERIAAVCEEVFIRYGRSLKPDLLVSKWFHFRQFLGDDTGNTNLAALVDERSLIPADRWCRGEDYVWYSTPVYRSDLKSGKTGDAALEGRYLRAICGETPFEVLKYDYFRWRVTVGEALAQGGIAFGAWKGGWSGGQDREDPHLKTYFDFIRKQDRVWQRRQSHAEVGLLFPREALRRGDASFLDGFRRIGRALAGGAFLFDVIIDQQMDAAELARHRLIVIPESRYMTPLQGQWIDAYRQAGGRVLTLAGNATRDVNQAWTVYRGDEDAPESIRSAVRELLGDAGSSFDVPWTVQVYADRQIVAKRLLLHLVNFNRDESREGYESPIAASPARIDLRLPDGFKVRRVRFLTPEARPRSLRFETAPNRLQMITPGWVVYGLCVIEG